MVSTSRNLPIRRFLLVLIGCMGPVWCRNGERYRQSLNFTLDMPQFRIVQDAVELALQYVDNIQSATTCNEGTGSVLNVLFDNSAWKAQAEVAVRLSNLLTKNWATIERTDGYLEDALLFAMTRTTIELEALAFGCAIAFEPFVYRNMSKFCAYSYHTGNGTIKSHDISVEYDYFPSEWYLGAKLKFHNLTKYKEFNVTQKLSEYDAKGIKVHKTATNFMEPRMEYEDGFWTRPYFDCGGGNIWMITFNSPIMAIINDSWNFAGVATVDIALNILDIDQCDVTDEKKHLALNVFQGTHHCKPSTMCATRSGFGFKRGTYYCFCRPGFYFPDSSASPQAFTGFDVEKAYADWIHLGSQDYIIKYDCLPCPEGCDTCLDSTPCMAEYNWTSRSFLLALLGLMFLSICGALVMVLQYRKDPVMSSFGVVVLIVIGIGGISAAFTDLALFFRPSMPSCTFRIWLQHISFVLIYGPLILKSGRTARSLAVKGSNKMQIKNRTFLKNFSLTVALMIFYLTFWTTIRPPQPEIVKTNQRKQKFYICQENWVDYGLLTVEGLFLVWGVFICHKNRKFPSSFNESKLTAWAVYSTVIMKHTLLLLRIFLVGWISPDLLFFLYILEVQVPVAVTLLLTFGPKFRFIYATPATTLNSETFGEEMAQEARTVSTTNELPVNAEFLSKLQHRA